MSLPLEPSLIEAVMDLLFSNGKNWFDDMEIMDCYGVGVESVQPGMDAHFAGLWCAWYADQMTTACGLCWSCATFELGMHLASIELVLSGRPQSQLLYEELTFIIQTLFVHEHNHLNEPRKVRDLKRRFKDAAEEAQDIIDLFLSAVHFRNKGLVTRSDDVFKTSLNLDNVMRLIESIKVEFMAININNMKMDLSPRIDRLIKTQSTAAAGTSCTRNPLGTKKPLEEIVVGHDCEADLIRNKLVEYQKQLDVVSIVGMGKLGNDRFVVYHLHV